MLPVAILSSDEFDATSVDPTTVRAGATGTETSLFRTAVEDVDQDGDEDMMLLVRMQQMELTCDDTAVEVKGETVGGQKFEGSKVVTMKGCG